MADIAKELASLGKEIEAAKKSLAQLEGRESEIHRRSKEEFGVNSVEELEALLKEEQKKSSELLTAIEEKFKDLKEKYAW